MGMREAGEPLLSIGEFGRRSGLSLKALRLYERLGLLRPAQVNRRTGYRRYRESQVLTARLVAMLRELDMPLAKVAEVVSSPDERGAELLAEYWNEVERRVASQRALTKLLRAGLRDRDQRSGEFDVREREVPERLVLTARCRLRLPELDGWVAATRQRLVAAAHAYGGMVAPPFVVFHSEVGRDSTGPVEVCVSVDPARDVTVESELRREPAHEEAYARVTKAHFEPPFILSAYDAVAIWIRAHGRHRAGAPREIYLPGVDPDQAGANEDVCEVAIPMR